MNLLDELKTYFYDKGVTLTKDEVMKLVASTGVSFKGSALPTTNPGVPTKPEYWVTAQPGTYTHFGGLVVVKELAILAWNGTSWLLSESGFVTKYDSIIFKGEITIDRVNNKIIIPRFVYSKKGSSFIAKSATDFGSADAFTFNLQLSEFVTDTLFFDAGRLEEGLNPFYIESDGTVNTINPRSIIILRMSGGVITSQFNFNDPAKFNSYLNRADVQNALAFKSEITIDRVNNKVVVPRFVYSKQTGGFIAKTATDFGSADAFTFSLQTDPNVTDTLFFDGGRLEAGQNPFYTESGGTITTITPKSIIILRMSGGIITSNFNFHDPSKFASAMYDRLGSIAGLTSSYKININTVAKTITWTPTAAAYVVLGGDNYAMSTTPISEAIQITGTSYFGIFYLYFQVSTKKVRLFHSSQRAAAKNADHVLLGWMFDLKADTMVSLVKNIYFDGLLIGLDSHLEAIMFKDAEITIDRINNKVIIPRFVYSRKWNSFISKRATDFGSADAFTFNLQTDPFVTDTLFFDGGKLEAGQNPFYVETGGTVETMNPRSIVILRMSGGIITSNFNYYDPAKYAQATVQAVNELILPPKFWMIQGQKQALYKSSIIRNENERGNEIVIANFAESDTDFNYPTFESVYNNYELDPSKLKPTIRVITKNYSDKLKDYGVDIAVNTVAANAKVGLKKVWNCIGASITNRGAAYYTKLYLNHIQSGLTLTNVGTMDNSGGVKGEGREGWGWANIVGKDNTHLGDNIPITRLADGATTSGLYQNPFLKLADANDKANNPAWCFRNTGANSELSYATDPDKSGNFYIFDYAYYLSSHSVTTPDLITFDLAGNDITENSAAGVTNALFGIEVVLRQIKKALPNVKIGIMPSTGRGDNSDRWTFLCDWINQLNTKLASLALSNVEIIGLWAHMNTHFIYDYSGTANLKSDGNLTKAFTKSEAIHFNRNGYLPYAKALGAYILNVI